MKYEKLVTAIQKRLDELDLSEQAACRRAGLKPDAIRNIRRERAPKGETITALAKALNLAPDRLMRAYLADAEGAGAVNAPSKASSVVESFGEEYVRIPVFDLRLSAGPGAYSDADGTPSAYEHFRFQWLRDITNAPISDLLLATVDGDSMANTLHTGDFVLLDRSQQNALKDGIYALRSHDDLLVKRITVDPRDGRLTIGSDNPQYNTFTDVNPDDVSIIGRAIWLGRRL